VEEAFFPYPADFLDMIHEHILPLKGYTPQRDCSGADLLRRNKNGI
jgi:2-oxoisovalerate dehydrogenase E1 component